MNSATAENPTKRLNYHKQFEQPAVTEIKFYWIGKAITCYQVHFGQFLREGPVRLNFIRTYAQRNGKIKLSKGNGYTRNTSDKCYLSIPTTKKIRKDEVQQLRLSKSNGLTTNRKVKTAESNHRMLDKFYKDKNGLNLNIIKQGKNIYEAFLNKLMLANANPRDGVLKKVSMSTLQGKSSQNSKMAQTNQDIVVQKNIDTSEKVCNQQNNVQELGNNNGNELMTEQTRIKSSENIKALVVVREDRSHTKQNRKNKGTYVLTKQNNIMKMPKEHIFKKHRPDIDYHLKKLAEKYRTTNKKLDLNNDQNKFPETKKINKPVNNVKKREIELKQKVLKHELKKKMALNIVKDIKQLSNANVKKKSVSISLDAINTTVLTSKSNQDNGIENGIQTSSNKSIILTINMKGNNIPKNNFQNFPKTTGTIPQSKIPSQDTKNVYNKVLTDNTVKEKSIYPLAKIKNESYFSGIETKIDKNEVTGKMSNTTPSTILVSIEGEIKRETMPIKIKDFSKKVSLVKASTQPVIPQENKKDIEPESIDKNKQKEYNNTAKSISIENKFRSYDTIKHDARLKCNDLKISALAINIENPRDVKEDQKIMQLKNLPTTIKSKDFTQLVSTICDSDGRESLKGDKTHNTMTDADNGKQDKRERITQASPSLTTQLNSANKVSVKKISQHYLPNDIKNRNQPKEKTILSLVPIASKNKSCTDFSEKEKETLIESNKKKSLQMNNYEEAINEVTLCNEKNHYEKSIKEETLKIVPEPIFSDLMEDMESTSGHKKEKMLNDSLIRKIETDKSVRKGKIDKSQKYIAESQENTYNKPIPKEHEISEVKEHVDQSVANSKYERQHSANEQKSNKLEETIKKNSTKINERLHSTNQNANLEKTLLLYVDRFRKVKDEIKKLQNETIPLESTYIKSSLQQLGSRERNKDAIEPKTTLVKIDDLNKLKKCSRGNEYKSIVNHRTLNENKEQKSQSFKNCLIPLSSQKNAEHEKQVRTAVDDKYKFKTVNLKFDDTTLESIQNCWKIIRELPLSQRIFCVHDTDSIIIFSTVKQIREDEKEIMNSLGNFKDKLSEGIKDTQLILQKSATKNSKELQPDDHIIYVLSCQNKDFCLSLLRAINKNRPIREIRTLNRKGNFLSKLESGNEVNFKKYDYNDLSVFGNVFIMHGLTKVSLLKHSIDLSVTGMKLKQGLEKNSSSSDSKVEEEIVIKDVINANKTIQLEGNTHDIHSKDDIVSGKQKLNENPVSKPNTKNTTEPHSMKFLGNKESEKNENNINDGLFKVKTSKNVTIFQVKKKINKKKSKRFGEIKKPLKKNKTALTSSSVKNKNASSFKELTDSIKLNSQHIFSNIGNVRGLYSNNVISSPRKIEKQCLVICEKFIRNNINNREKENIKVFDDLLKTDGHHALRIDKSSGKGPDKIPQQNKNSFYEIYKKKHEQKTILQLKNQKSENHLKIKSNNMTKTPEKLQQMMLHEYSSDASPVGQTMNPGKNLNSTVISKDNKRILLMDEHLVSDNCNENPLNLELTKETNDEEDNNPTDINMLNEFGTMLPIGNKNLSQNINEDYELGIDAHKIEINTVPKAETDKSRIASINLNIMCTLNKPKRFKIQNYKRFRKQDIVIHKITKPISSSYKMFINKKVGNFKELTDYLKQNRKITNIIDIIKGHKTSSFKELTNIIKTKMNKRSNSGDLRKEEEGTCSKYVNSNDNENLQRRTDMRPLEKERSNLVPNFGSKVFPIDSSYTDNNSKWAENTSTNQNQSTKNKYDVANSKSEKKEEHQSEYVLVCDKTQIINDQINLINHVIKNSQLTELEKKQSSLRKYLKERENESLINTKIDSNTNEVKAKSSLKCQEIPQATNLNSCSGKSNEPNSVVYSEANDISNKQYVKAIDQKEIDTLKNYKENKHFIKTLQNKNNPQENSILLANKISKSDKEAFGNKPLFISKSFVKQESGTSKGKGDSGYNSFCKTISRNSQLNEKHENMGSLKNNKRNYIESNAPNSTNQLFTSDSLSNGINKKNEEKEYVEKSSKYSDSSLQSEDRVTASKQLIEKVNQLSLHNIHSMDNSSHRNLRRNLTSEKIKTMESNRTKLIDKNNEMCKYKERLKLMDSERNPLNNNLDTTNLLALNSSRKDTKPCMKAATQTSSDNQQSQLEIKVKSHGELPEKAIKIKPESKEGKRMDSEDNVENNNMVTDNKSLIEKIKQINIESKKLMEKVKEINGGELNGGVKNQLQNQYPENLTDTAELKEPTMKPFSLIDNIRIKLNISDETRNKLPLASDVQLQIGISDNEDVQSPTKYVRDQIQQTKDMEDKSFGYPNLCQVKKVSREKGCELPVSNLRNDHAKSQPPQTDSKPDVDGPINMNVPVKLESLHTSKFKLTQSINSIKPKVKENVFDDQLLSCIDKRKDYKNIISSSDLFIPKKQETMKENSIKPQIINIENPGSTYKKASNNLLSAERSTMIYEEMKKDGDKPKSGKIGLENALNSGGIPIAPRSKELKNDEKIDSTKLSEGTKVVEDNARKKHKFTATENNNRIPLQKLESRKSKDLRTQKQNFNKNIYVRNKPKTVHEKQINKNVNKVRKLISFKQMCKNTDNNILVKRKKETANASNPGHLAISLLKTEVNIEGLLSKEAKLDSCITPQHMAHFNGGIKKNTKKIVTPEEIKFKISKYRHKQQEKNETVRHQQSISKQKKKLQAFIRNSKSPAYGITRKRKGSNLISMVLPRSAQDIQEVLSKPGPLDETYKRRKRFSLRSESLTNQFKGSTGSMSFNVISNKPDVFLKTFGAGLNPQEIRIDSNKEGINLNYIKHSADNEIVNQMKNSEANKQEPGTMKVQAESKQHPQVQLIPLFEEPQKSINYKNTKSSKSSAPIIEPSIRVLGDSDVLANKECSYGRCTHRNDKVHNERKPKEKKGLTKTKSMQTEFYTMTKKNMKLSAPKSELTSLMDSVVTNVKTKLQRLPSSMTKLMTQSQAKKKWVQFSGVVKNRLFDDLKISKVHKKIMDLHEGIKKKSKSDTMLTEVSASKNISKEHKKESKDDTYQLLHQNKSKVKNDRGNLSENKKMATKIVQKNEVKKASEENVGVVNKHNKMKLTDNKGKSKHLSYADLLNELYVKHQKSQRKTLQFTEKGS